MKPTIRFILILFVLICGSGGLALAEQSIGQNVVSACSKDLTSLKTNEEITLEEQRCTSAYNMDLNLKNASLEIWTRGLTARSYDLQLFETAFMFLIVVAMVTFGSLFCLIEYRKGTDTTTTFKWGPNALEVNSKLMGILILSFSLAFAYLFFEKAYTISENGSQTAPPETNGSAPFTSPGPVPISNGG